MATPKRLSVVKHRPVTPPQPTRRPLSVTGRVFGALAFGAMLAAVEPRSVEAAVQQAPPAAAAETTVEAPAGPARVVVTVEVQGLRVPQVTVKLLRAGSNLVIAQTLSSPLGQVDFEDVPAGRYFVRAIRDGFTDTDSAPFTVEEGSTSQVLVEMRLTFIRESVEVVVPANSPTESLQPVAVSDVLTGTRMDVQPLAGDDFQSLLAVLPSIIRGPDGRLRVKGGPPTTGALQVSSASLNDPSTGDFDLELPSGAVESVEVLSNPFAAEYGRFSTSVTQVTTKRGTNEWVFKPDNLLPSFGSGFINKFEPRLSISGPLKRDRLLLGQFMQYRFGRTPVKSLPGEPEIGIESFDSYTRLDAVVSPRHALTAGMIYFPRKITNATLSTFRPEETTQRFTQEGFAAGIADRVILTASAVLESTIAARTFEVSQHTLGDRPMVYAPRGQSGNFFSQQERDVSSIQVVEALTLSVDRWRGQHVFKFGVDFQHSRFDGDDLGQTVRVVRGDGSLAEETTFGLEAAPEVSGTELALFAQDRWRVSDRLSLELGLRVDRDVVVERLNYSPRLGAAVTVLANGRGILRGGFGKFAERTPLTVGAFRQYEARTITRFGPTGAPTGPPVTLAHEIDGELHTPESLVRTIAWDQRFGRKVFFKAAYLHRSGSHAYVVDPDAARAVLALSSSGTSTYWELETTARFLASEHRDLSVSYVRSRSTLDLNDYDQFFGNFRTPIIRANEHSLSPTDVPHRLIVRGTIGLPGKWVLSPLYEWRSGFPWSAVDEYQNFVGPRNRSGRLPNVSTLDFTIARPLRLFKYRFTGGFKVYNAIGTGNERDIQTNATASDYGAVYNPIRRSIGILISTSRP